MKIKHKEKERMIVFVLTSTKVVKQGTCNMLQFKWVGLFPIRTTHAAVALSQTPTLNKRWYLLYFFVLLSFNSLSLSAVISHHHLLIIKKHEPSNHNMANSNNSNGGSSQTTMMRIAPDQRPYVKVSSLIQLRYSIILLHVYSYSSL